MMTMNAEEIFDRHRAVSGLGSKRKKRIVQGLGGYVPNTNVPLSLKMHLPSAMQKEEKMMKTYIGMQMQLDAS
jgi:hypothetical protein